MPYTVRVMCPRCKRTFTYRSDEPPLFGDCPDCQRIPDLTEQEARIENDLKDDR